MKKTTLLITALAAIGITSAAQAGTTSIDINSGSGVLFTGTFDGSTGFVSTPTATVALTDDWSVTVGPGFFFGNETGGNPLDSMETLLPSQYGVGANTTGTFTLTGGLATDSVTFEMYAAEGYNLSFEGSTPVNIFNSSVFGTHDFQQIGSTVTGSTSYVASFGNQGTFNSGIAAVRITITPIPEPSAVPLLLGIAGLTLVLRLRRRRS